MEDKRQLFEKVASEYSLPLINWAYKKLGDRSRAEDLTQEVFLQVYSALEKGGTEILQIDHFIWKIAHYTWCNYLRKNQHYKMCIPMEQFHMVDEGDFVSELIEKQEQEEMLCNIRKSISGLSYLKREIMVSFYIDGKAIKDIAGKYDMTEGNVKWYLHSTRKSIKEEIGMEQSKYIYRPKKLHLAISGQVVAAPDTKVINQSLTMQNICLLCYPSAKTKKELADMLGIPMAYIESDLDWLTEKEFLTVVGERYATNFIIEDLKQSQEIYKIYCEHKEKLMDVIVDRILDKEEAIREIGFGGNDTSMEKMLWLLLYQFCNHLKKPDCIEAPIRPDGGKYFPLGFDRNVDADEVIEDYCAGWDFNGPMSNDNFMWFGLYNFGNSEIVDLLDGYDNWNALHNMLKSLLDEACEISDLNEDEKLLCAELSQKGFVEIKEKRIYPRFYVFTKKQYEELVKNIFNPIADKIGDEMDLLRGDFERYFADKMPPQLKDYKMLCVRKAMYDMSFVCTFEAFRDGKLYVPENREEGEFLTFMYIKG